MTRTLEIDSPLPWWLSWIPDRLVPHWIELDVELDLDWSWQNDGIGAYEFWGQKCFDRGNNYIEVHRLNRHYFEWSEIPWLWKLWRKKLARAIEAAAESESKSDGVREELSEYES